MTSTPEMRQEVLATIKRNSPVSVFRLLELFPEGRRSDVREAVSVLLDEGQVELSAAWRLTCADGTEEAR
jgi:hypothetical protein